MSTGRAKAKAKKKCTNQTIPLCKAFHALQASIFSLAPSAIVSYQVWQYYLVLSLSSSHRLSIFVSIELDFVS